MWPRNIESLLNIRSSRLFSCVIVKSKCAKAVQAIKMTTQLADWENSKENIQPLKQGRSGTKLTEAFKEREGTTQSKRDEELKKQKQ